MRRCGVSSKGLPRETFSEYFEYIHLQLTHPGFTKRKGESWPEHRVRLEKHHTSRDSRSEYNVIFRLLNAADFGVPQRRERVFLVGFRSDLKLEWTFPRKSHSEDALLAAKWVTGEYWDTHEVAKKHRPNLENRLLTRVERLRRDLPDPEQRFLRSVANHDFNPGARSYPGHIGSLLDEPAKTLKGGITAFPAARICFCAPTDVFVTLPFGRLRGFRHSRTTTSSPGLGRRPCGNWATRSLCAWRR